jgi:hypothetical protein
MPATRTPIEKLPRNASAWTEAPEAWVADLSGPGKMLHRTTVVAAPHGGITTHAQTVCGGYLTRANLYFDPPADLDECDACLMDNTVYHVAYMYRDTDGRYLYAGYSSGLVERIGKHRRESPWWRPDLVLTYEVFDSEVEARAAETAAIRKYWPRYNLAAKGGGPRENAPKATLHVHYDVLVRLVAERLEVPADSVGTGLCADFLGVNRSTCYRISVDREYVVSSSLVAQVMTIFGGIPEGVFEARLPTARHLSVVA